MTDSSLPTIGAVTRVAFALFLTTGLLLFLVAMRTFDPHSNAPLMTLRTMDTTEPVSLPAPPPPTAEVTPPAPPITPDLPVLELELDSIAPPVEATLLPDTKMSLSMSDFASVADQPRERITFAGSDLDTKPRLVYRPAFTFPEAQKSRGITQARVTLEVAINSTGKVRVLRVLDSPHPDFSEAAKSFASRSKFTSPIKDGRSVNTVFKWPLDFVL
ncbi:MAG: energy transducer TonB [Verrucomicrobiales bacterium]|nr:energy transducer TonB [Verrucomicrobiales bacterium]